MTSYYIRLEGYLIAALRSSPAAGFEPYPVEQPFPAIGDAFKDGILYPHPAQEYAPETDMHAHAYTFNPATPAWEVDYDVFNPRLVEVLRWYRRSATNAAPAVIREFNNEE